MKKHHKSPLLYSKSFEAVWRLLVMNRLKLKLFTISLNFCFMLFTDSLNCVIVLGYFLGDVAFLKSCLYLKQYHIIIISLYHNIFKHFDWWYHSSHFLMENSHAHHNTLIQENKELLKIYDLFYLLGLRRAHNNFECSLSAQWIKSMCSRIKSSLKMSDKWFIHKVILWL